MKLRKLALRLLGILCLLFLAAAPQAAYGKFTIIVLPDTQNYSDDNPDVYFKAQTQWIADSKSTLNIAFVAHVGDVVNTRTSATEYTRANEAMDWLDSGAVPYGVSPGNHDMGSGSLYPSYFGTTRFSGKPYFKPDSSYDDYNHYFLFTADGMDFIIIFLQYNPGTAVLDWADARLKAYPNRRGIVVSHNILSTGNPANRTTEGQNIFNALNDNPNLFMMLCGHISGEGRRVDTGTNGNTIYSVLADYQSETNGGNGFLRIMEYDPNTDLINVTSYSPYTETYKTAGSSQFSLSYNMLYGDINAIDCDVDGSDLAVWIADYAHKAIDVAPFAQNFGNNACQ